MAPHRNAKHILIVDDEAAVRDLLRDCLEMEGFEISESESGEETIARLKAGGIDLITLDLNLGGENGFDIVRTIRARHDVPIIMITGKGDTIDRVVGLELGADDYIAKPFELREVTARIRAVLRRYEHVVDRSSSSGPSPDPAPTLADASAHGAVADERYHFAGLTLDVTRRCLGASDGATRDGAAGSGDGIELTTSEFDLLVAFVRRARRVLSRDNIMDLLRGHDWSPTDRSIDALIVRLRRKIEPDPATPSLIKTVRGVGYVFAGDVTKLT